MLLKIGVGMTGYGLLAILAVGVIHTFGWGGVLPLVVLAGIGLMLLYGLQHWEDL